MSRDTLLKRELSEKDVNRLRNIITKKYGDSTTNQVGYRKLEQEYKEGDVWEENGKTWTIKDGLKQTLTKLDIAKKASRMPLACPECGEAMKLSLDKKMYPIHKMCSLCVSKMESRLKLEGKYQDYVKKMVTNNMITHLEEAEQYITEIEKQTVDTYVTEDGEIEDWGNSEVDKSQKIRDIKEDIKNTLETMKKENIY